MTMNTFVAAKFIVEVLQRWTCQLKQFVEWKEQLTKYLLLDKDISEADDDEVPAKSMRLEKDLKAEIDFSEATHKLMKQILELQEMLETQLRRINTERESFAEYLSYSFRNVPQDKRLYCFTECMEIILKHRVKEE